MALSKGWDYTDNLYFNRNTTRTTIDTKGCLGLFADKVMGVDGCIADYCRTHTQKEAFLYNNRLFLGTERNATNVAQYKKNREYIISRY